MQKDLDKLREIESYYQEILNFIKESEKVLLLIEAADDPLSKRARQVIISNKIKFEKLGYKIAYRVYEENFSRYEELACSKLPQIRLFRKQKLIKKHVGVPSQLHINELLEEALCKKK